MQPIKILVVDDHALFRSGVRTALERDGDMQVVGEATDCIEALAKVRQLHPDVVLMDIGIPGGDGLEAAQAIKRELPEIKIIVLTVHDSRANLLRAIKGGVEGFLSKNIRANALVASLRGVMKGEAAISRKRTIEVIKELSRLSKIETGQVKGQLTCREKQVLSQLSKGLSNQEIADELFISENTVKAHLAHIYKKLQMHSRTEASAYAQRLGLTQGTGHQDVYTAPPH